MDNVHITAYFIAALFQFSPKSHVNFNADRPLVCSIRLSFNLSKIRKHNDLF